MELANGILFPHSNLLLIRPSRGLHVQLHSEGAHPRGGVNVTGSTVLEGLWEPQRTLTTIIICFLSL